MYSVLQKNQNQKQKHVNFNQKLLITPNFTETD
jgi:hypothetical protein